MAVEPTNSTSPTHRPTFATPLLQSPRSQTLHWRLPPPFHQHTLIGQSRAAWHTSFIVPTLNLVLDAGLIIDDSRPRNVFITHGHADHSYHVLTYCRRRAMPDVYVPKETAGLLGEYIDSGKSLNLGWRIPGRLLNGSYASESEKSSKPGTPVGDRNGDIDTDSFDEEEDLAMGLLPTHNIIPVSADEDKSYVLKTNSAISVSILPREHTVPSVGYLFTQTSNRLLPQYRSLPGQQLKHLRETGTVITSPYKSRIFAFLGDGTHSSLLGDPEWLIGNEEKGISKCPVVITECSFLYEEHRAQGEKTKHTVWAELERVVRRHEGTIWVLIHFSKRYKEGEVVKFFEGLGEGCPRNIVVWADGGGEVDVGGNGRVPVSFSR